jgi:hypothetical protein
MTESEDETSISYLTSQLCVSCILSENPATNRLISVLDYNICRYRVNIIII